MFRVKNYNIKSLKSQELIKKITLDCRFIDLGTWICIKSLNKKLEKNYNLMNEYKTN